MELQLGKPSLDTAKIQKLLDDPYNYACLTQAKLGSQCVVHVFLRAVLSVRGLFAKMRLAIICETSSGLSEKGLS